MIIIRDLSDLHTLRLRVMSGDILEVYNSHYNISKYYWVYGGILTCTYNEGTWTDTCYASEFFRDIRIALLDAKRYFIKLVVDSNVGRTEVVRLDEEALI